MEKLLNKTETEKKAVTKAIGILARNLVTATTNVEEEVVEEEVLVEEEVVVDEEVVDPESATANNNELIKNTFEPLYEIGNNYLNTIKYEKNRLEYDIVNMNNFMIFHNDVIDVINFSKTFIPKIDIIYQSITEQYMKLEKINILLNLDFEGKTEALILQNILESKKLISIMENDIQKLTDLKIYESILNYIPIALN